MKKVLLTAACLFVASQASAVSLNVNEMVFWDAADPRGLGGYTDPAVTGFVNFTAATGTLNSSVDFFGFPWQADVKWATETPGVHTWSGNDALPSFNPKTGITTYSYYTYNFTLAAGDVAVGFFFDWSTNIDIPVLTVLHPNGDGTWSAVDIEWTSYPGGSLAGTGVGTGMQTAPFPGQWPAFAGDTDVPPVITLTGINPVIMTVGDPAYVDAGATAADTEDGDLGAVVGVGVGVVDVDVANSDPGYTITYTVSDSTGQGTVATRTVFVNDPGAPLDTVPPVITIVGNPLLIALNGAYDPLTGVSATDNVDGVIPVDNIVVSEDTVDTSVAGAWYTVCYNVQDAALNAAIMKCRDVNIENLDITLPVLKLVGADTITVVQGATFTDPGYTATDDRDGDIAASVVKSGDTVNTAVVGKYICIYNVSDTAGNAAPEKTRIINVVAPECKVGGAIVNNFTMYDNGGGIVGGSNTVKFHWDGSLLTDTDVVDGQEIVPGNATLGTECLFFGYPWFADPVWFFGPGIYDFDTCPVGDIAAGIGGSLTDGSSQCTPGDPANIVTMVVSEGQIGAHMLFSWSASVNIDMFNVFDQNAVSGGQMAPDCGGAYANKVWDLSSSDIDEDGIMGYQFVDGPFKGFSGNLNMMRPDSDTASLPTDVPVLEIQGDNPLSLAMDAIFTCPGAMAEDLVDGPLCDKITIVGCDTVNTHVPGAEKVTYQVVDSDGYKVSHDLLVFVFVTASDVDGDGYSIENDCNDFNPTINPGMCDIKSDGIDQDCDGVDRTKGKPCSEGSTSAATEGKGKTCADGIDNDGDGLTDCDDTDCSMKKHCK